MEKKILVIGAGNWQRSGIKKLIQSGYKVHLADSRNSLLKNFKKIKKHKVKLLDKNDFLKIIKKHKISNCTSFNSDFAVPIINTINKRLGKSYYNSKIISIFTKKEAFRNFQKKNKFKHPYYITDTKKILNYRNYKCNFLIKPNISSGSKGVFQVNQFTKRDKIVKNLNISKDISLDKKIIFEKNIPGKEYGGNCYISDGKFIDLKITKKFLNKNKIIGHIYPSDLGLNMQNRIRNELISYIKKLNIRNSIINFDIKIFKNKIFILELALRGGANGITEIINYATNFDYEKLSFEKKLFKLKKSKFFYCSYIFGSKYDGYLDTFKFNLKNNNFVLKKIFFKKKNDIISKFTSNDLSIGMIIFKVKKIGDFFIKKNLFEKKLKLSLK